VTARKDGLPKRNGPLPGNGGRPPKPIDREVMKRAAGIGCNVAEIAALNGISFVQFYQRLKTDPTLQAELDEARNNGRATLRRYQWQRAAAGSDTMLIWLGKNMLEQTDKHELTGKDGTAISYVIRAPTPVESADEWLRLHAPPSQLTDNSMIVDGESINDPPPSRLNGKKHE
jgi:hypothetical protein